VAAGVERLVYLSFVNPVPDATCTLAGHHWATEEHIRSTGRPFTFLRMNLYLDFCRRWCRMARSPDRGSARTRRSRRGSSSG
jgi:hypothetical protein